MREHQYSSSSGFSSLTGQQKAALKTSWKAIRNQALHATMRKIFHKLQDVCPKAKEMFCKGAVVDRLGAADCVATVDDHCRELGKLFDDMISRLDQPDEVASLVTAIGADHASLKFSSGFKGEIWERLGEIAMETICAMDGVQKCREAPRAWRMLLACAIDRLRFGFDNEAKMSSRRSLLNLSDTDQTGESSTADGTTDSPASLTRVDKLKLEYTKSSPYIAADENLDEFKCCENVVKIERETSQHPVPFCDTSKTFKLIDCHD